MKVSSRVIRNWSLEQLQPLSELDPLYIVLLDKVMFFQKPLEHLDDKVLTRVHSMELV